MRELLLDKKTRCTAALCWPNVKIKALSPPPPSQSPEPAPDDRSNLLTTLTSHILFSRAQS